MLTITEHLPDGLLELGAEQLHTRLDGPTLIHLTGRREQPVLISCLLHGNEDTGWLAVRELLRHWHGRTLPRALSVLIGNVAAARHRQRRIDGQPDYNRIWKGGDTPEHAMARRVLDEMRDRDVFAAIDIHNNTGVNPHYACVNVLDNRYLHLAQLFSRTVVYFIRPDTVASRAFAGLCPAVTLECGQPGQPHGTEHAFSFADAVLNLSQHPVHPIGAQDIDLFHTTATVTVPETLTLGFEPEASDIWFADDLDHLNFRELPAGSLLGWTHPGADARLSARDEAGNEVADRYFVFDRQEIRTRIPVMPSMLTLDTRVIRQDCLCYFMERYRVPGPSHD
jgi:hypothetical protein